MAAPMVPAATSYMSASARSRSQAPRATTRDLPGQPVADRRRRRPRSEYSFIPSGRRYAIITLIEVMIATRTAPSMNTTEALVDERRGSAPAAPILPPTSETMRSRCPRCQHSSTVPRGAGRHGADRHEAMPAEAGRRRTLPSAPSDPDPTAHDGGRVVQERLHPLQAGSRGCLSILAGPAALTSSCVLPFLPFLFWQIRLEHSRRLFREEREKLADPDSRRAKAEVEALLKRDAP